MYSAALGQLMAKPLPLGADVADVAAAVTVAAPAAGGLQAQGEVQHTLSVPLSNHAADRTPSAFCLQRGRTAGYKRLKRLQDPLSESLEQDRLYVLTARVLGAPPPHLR